MKAGNVTLRLMADDSPFQAALDQLRHNVEQASHTMLEIAVYGDVVETDFHLVEPEVLGFSPRQEIAKRDANEWQKPPTTQNLAITSLPQDPQESGTIQPGFRVSARKEGMSSRINRPTSRG